MHGEAVVAGISGAGQDLVAVGGAPGQGGRAEVCDLSGDEGAAQSDGVIELQRHGHRLFGQFPAGVHRGAEMMRGQVGQESRLGGRRVWAL